MRHLIVGLVLAVALAGAPSTPANAATHGTCPQWHAAARAAGFSEQQWPRLSRIMYRESRCHPRAVNRTSGATGLLQIMPMWARRCRTLRTGLAVPATNLRCGRYILRVQGWSAW